MTMPVLDTPYTELADDIGMHLLGAHIPLTLLLDLAEQFGPPSSDILRAEPCESLDWTRPPADEVA